MPENQPAPQKLYALLVGVDKFKNDRFSSLDGCVNDVEAVDEYLKGLKGFELDAVILTSEKPKRKKKEEAPVKPPELPTKAAITHHFMTHLGKAGPGDVVLFYMASHGKPEKTNIESFARIGINRNIESFVCYDSQSPDNETDYTSFLADKEIRWLAARLNQEAHIVIIMDTCHSGDPRGDKIRYGKGEVMNSFRGNGAERDIRGYDKFIFGDPEFAKKYNTEMIPREKFDNQTVGEVLPFANHVFMGACLATEKAWEAEYKNYERGGLFTISLLRFLRNSGPDVSYDDLAQYLPLSMRDWPKDKQQNPVIHNYLNDPKGIHRNFLGGIAKPRQVKHKMVFNREQGWMINFGAIHGLQELDKKIKVHIYVNGSEKEPHVGEISTVHSTYSKVDIKEADLDNEKLYQIGVLAFMLEPLPVVISGDNKTSKKVRQYLNDKLDHAPVRYLNLTKEEKAPAYVVRTEAESLVITYANDNKPLVEQIHSISEKGMDLLYAYLMQIAQWELVKRLSNPKTMLDKHPAQGVSQYPVELKIYEKGKDEAYHEREFWQNKMDFSPNSINMDKEDCCFIKMELINHSSEDLFIGLMYMSMQFGVETQLIPEGISLPGKKEGKEASRMFAMSEKSIELVNYEHVLEYGWAESVDFLKLVVSKKPFSHIPFQMKELPFPVKERRRALKFRDPRSQPTPPDDWMATTYQISLTNPKI